MILWIRKRWQETKHWGRASIEFMITIVASFLPVFLGAVVTTCWSEKGLVASFISNFSYGEVFLYTSAFLAPYAHKKLRKKEPLPSVIIGVIAILSFVIGALAFSFVRMEDVLSKKMNIPPDAITYVGIAIVISTIIVWYYSVWADHSIRINASLINKKQQDDLGDRFDSLMGNSKI
ncbi:hypothetical protein BV924_01025 [Pectobacterium odoriferum]|uniref:Uncharacterized protein n=1 Tax=Pectobacterium odoriferum TaxID=78398 RepID=A0ABD6VW28_9GAMM|nr:hypothetical protein [Pectobacterium odoriferum]POE15391.1 hypothetical protein BV924_01025 [Pectobacterium odoriferum]POE28930.1 hypothetical protein BV926_01025 [Pectobacterium odoriferum]POE34277.1 hypothetical protein BV919_01025 [Pectobacterium odoriferum]